jgi:hypothetical protein
VAYTRRNTTDGVTRMNKDLYDNLQDGIDELLIYKKVAVNVVEKFGLDNTGTYDISESLQNIINESEETILYFPEGIYLINNPITINRQISFIGDHLSKYLYHVTDYKNLKGTIFVASPTFPKQTFMFTTTNYTRVTFQNILFIGNTVSFEIKEDISHDGVLVEKYSYVFSKDEVSAIYLTGFYSIISSCSFIGFSGIGVYSEIYNTIKDCYSYECNVGFWVHTDNTAYNIRCQCCVCGIKIGVPNNFKTSKGSSNTLSMIRLDGIATFGMEVDGFSHSISNVLFDQINWSSIKIETGARSIFSNIILGRCCQKYASFNPEDIPQEDLKIASAIYLKGDMGPFSLDANFCKFNHLDDSSIQSEGPSLCIYSDGYINYIDINLSYLPHSEKDINFIKKLWKPEKQVNTNLTVNGDKILLIGYNSGQLPNSVCVNNTFLSTEVNPRSIYATQVGQFVKYQNELYMSVSSDNTWIKIQQ